MSRDNMVIVSIIKEKKKVKIPKDEYMLSTSLVLFGNIGAGRPNVFGLNVCAFSPVLWCSVSLSLSSVQLIHLQFLDNSQDSQSSPSYSPVPWVAQADSTFHCVIREYMVNKIQERYDRSMLAYRFKSYYRCRLLTFLRRLCRPSLSVTSLTLKALGRSCLLANTSRIASFNSSSCNQRGRKQIRTTTLRVHIRSILFIA